jgi:hypothetical protein
MRSNSHGLRPRQPNPKSASFMGTTTISSEFWLSIEWQFNSARYLIFQQEWSLNLLQCHGRLFRISKSCRTIQWTRCTKWYPTQFFILLRRTRTKRFISGEVLISLYWMISDSISHPTSHNANRAYRTGWSCRICNYPEQQSVIRKTLQGCHARMSRSKLWIITSVENVLILYCNVPKAIHVARYEETYLRKVG